VKAVMGIAKLVEGEVTVKVTTVGKVAGSI
jgi:hypothetical protein